MAAKMTTYMNTNFTCDENCVYQLKTNPIWNFLTFWINVTVFMKLI